MRFHRVASGFLAVIVVAAAALSSLSSPGEERSAGDGNAPPPIEELIPGGERSDADVMIDVLFEDDGRVVSMPLERYLIGVLASEMNASFEIEALRAQAVAARTNAMHNMYVTQKERHPYAQVCTDPSCCSAFRRDERLRELWGSVYVRNITRIVNAVVDTDGVYISYDGEPIVALFHSSSAGRTESGANVWAQELPYLLSVSSPETAEQVPEFVSSVSVPRAEFENIVLAEFPDASFDGDEEGWISGFVYSDSGRVSAASLGGVAVSGTELRALFGLRSTSLEVAWVRGEVVFTTAGYGHGVGMSQYGANAMAAAGSGYAEILRHYYSGVVVGR